MAHHKDAVIVNTIVRQALSSAEEVMGTNGLNAILRLSQLERFIDNFPPDNLEPGIQTVEYARFNAAIEEFYGRGGVGMLKRIGKASFQYAMREQSALLGWRGQPSNFCPNTSASSSCSTAWQTPSKRPMTKWTFGSKTKRAYSHTSKPPAESATTAPAKSRSAISTSALSVKPFSGAQANTTKSQKRTALPRAIPIAVLKSETA